MTGGGSSMRRAIVVIQIALVCVLLTGAGLLTRSLLRVLDVDPGFASGNVITLRVDPLRQLIDARSAERLLRYRPYPGSRSARCGSRWPHRRAPVRRQLWVAGMDGVINR